MNIDERPALDVQRQHRILSTDPTVQPQYEGQGLPELDDFFGFPTFPALRSTSCNLSTLPTFSTFINFWFISRSVTCRSKHDTLESKMATIELLSLFSLGTVQVMATSSGLKDFQPIIYNPENPGRRVTPSERQLHRLQPYARTDSMSEATLYSEGSSMASGSFLSSDTGKKKGKKLSLNDLPPDDRPAVKWAQKHLLMDLFTMVLWSDHVSDKEREVYLNEIVGQANTLFKTNLQLSKDLNSLISQSVTQFRSSLLEIVDWFTDEFMIKPLVVMSKERRVAHMVDRRWFDEASGIEQLLVFGNDTLQKIVLLHLYASNYTPLHDEKFLAELSTTTSHMFSHIAAGVECGINKVVEEESSGRSVRFLGECYTPRQLSYFNTIKDAFKLEVHKETLLA
ncbi:hypothetical protein EDD22DRAFT_855600 [Suillus occidentalis]|nr:hypothetical protein EDD22DRAFT_855600 [Suillus occidentalis]